MKSENHVNVRDFIYLDTPRLESVYAQLKQGLIQQLVETKTREGGIEVGLSGGVPWLSARLSGKGGVTGEQQVNRVLHDYLYSLVEEALGVRIRDISGFSAADWQTGRVHKTLGETQADFIRVMGRMKITDFMGLAVQLESMAGLMQAFEGLSKPPQGAPQAPSKSKDRSRASQRRASQSQGDDRVAQVVHLIKEFYGDLIVVKAFPVCDDNTYCLTGALGKDGLQDARAHLLLKYGAAPSARWTMLAQVAAVPPESTSDGAGSIKALPTGSATQFSDMSDAVEQLVDASTQVFAAAGLTMTVRYPAIAITPLAIYRS